MRSLFTRKRVIVALVVAILFGVGYVVWHQTQNGGPEWVTETVSRGDVESIVSVSGVVEAHNTAELSFPTTGNVATVLVKEGDGVVAGQVLATLEQGELLAEREDAVAALRIAEANRDELLSGPSSEERSVTSIAVDIARADLERTKAVEAEKVANAYHALLSSNLEAVPKDSDNADIPPSITGTYACGNEGTYTLSLFRSSTRSGFSYRLSGIEAGTFAAYTEASAPLGTCGLSVQFDSGESYSSRDWLVTIPNPRGANYVTYLNAYTLAKQQEANNVSAAEQVLEKAVLQQLLENATPRDEEIKRALAGVTQAVARLSAVEARIENRTLRTPFDGTVSAVSVVPGETVATNPVITVVANDQFELTVRIPEIDITKLAVGQQAEVIFDARRDETIPSSIAFISPLAIEIDGVAYFEAKLHFDNPPTWLRGGLNADVSIIVDRKGDVLRIPRRFLTEDGDAFSVLRPLGDTAVEETVEVGFIGNDGFVEVTSGLAEGDTIIAP